MMCALVSWYQFVPLQLTLILFIWFRGCLSRFLNWKANNFPIIVNRVLEGFTERWMLKPTTFHVNTPPTASFSFTCRWLWKVEAVTFVQAFVSKRSVNCNFISQSCTRIHFITVCISRKRKQESCSIYSGTLKCYNQHRWEVKSFSGNRGLLMQKRIFRMFHLVLMSSVDLALSLLIDDHLDI